MNNELVETKELTELVSQSGLPENKIQELMSNYGVYFSKAKEVVQGARDIVVVSEDQTDLMQEARTKRLELKRIRNDVEDTRKQLKEQSLRETKAIDGAANIIKALIIPVEEYLEEQEKFAERMQQQKRKLLLKQRVLELAELGCENAGTLYKLEDMDEDTYKNLLQVHKKSFDDAKEAEKKAVEDKARKEREALAEQERIKEENRKLKAEAEEKERLLKIEREKQEQKIKEYQEQANREKEELAKKMTEENRVLEEKAKKEAEEKLKLEKELADKRKLEDAEKLRVEAEKKAEEDKKRRELLAPDKDKILALAEFIEKIELPRVENKSTGAIIDEAGKRLKDISDYLIVSSRGL